MYFLSEIVRLFSFITVVRSSLRFYNVLLMATITMVWWRKIDLFLFVHYGAVLLLGLKTRNVANKNTAVVTCRPTPLSSARQQAYWINLNYPRLTKHWWTNLNINRVPSDVNLYIAMKIYVEPPKIRTCVLYSTCELNLWWPFEIGIPHLWHVKMYFIAMTLVIFRRYRSVYTFSEGNRIKIKVGCLSQKKTYIMENRDAQAVPPPPPPGSIESLLLN